MGPVGGRANGWVGRILGRGTGDISTAVRQWGTISVLLSAIFTPKWRTTRGRPLGMPRRRLLTTLTSLPTLLLPTHLLPTLLMGRRPMGLRKAGGNWVEGDRFFDR